MGGVCKDEIDKPVEQQSPGSDRTKVNGCYARTSETSRYEVTSSNIGKYIQNIKDHALIEKIMGVWPSEKSLMGWVSSR